MQFARLPDAGVPNTGATSVGPLDITTLPVPVGVPPGNCVPEQAPVKSAKVLGTDTVVASPLQ